MLHDTGLILFKTASGPGLAYRGRKRRKKKLPFPSWLD